MNVIDGETESLVEADRGQVVVLHIEHPDLQSGSGEVLKSLHCECSPKPRAVGARISRDYIDLTHGRIAVSRRVDLCPTESVNNPVGFVDQEPIGVEPGLSHVRREILSGPTALFRMPLEGPIVDPKERAIVESWSKRTQGHLSGRCNQVIIEGEWSTHLEQGPDANQTLDSHCSVDAVVSGGDPPEFRRRCG